MTADGHFQVPQPTNEAVRSYAVSDPHRKSLKSRLAELTDARTEVPMQIGGERRWGASRADIRSPHRHELAIAEYAVGGTKDIDAAIGAALAARKMWAATSYHERATMLGQSKTVHQAEIDAACETIDFWRYNAYFGDQLLRNQPSNDGTAWNRLEYRPLEGFIFAVSPFNFTSIAGNLPTAPMLMGNTVVFKPATQTLLVSHFLVELLLDRGVSGHVARGRAEHRSLPNVSAPGWRDRWQGLRRCARLRRHRRATHRAGARRLRVPGPEMLGGVARLHPAVDVEGDEDRARRPGRGDPPGRRRGLSQLHGRGDRPARLQQPHERHRVREEDGHGQGDSRRQRGRQGRLVHQADCHRDDRPGLQAPARGAVRANPHRLPLRRR